MSFRLALRTLRRSPWYATTVVGTVALKIRRDPAAPSAAVLLWSFTRL
jgi:hypothetical protein